MSSEWVTNTPHEARLRERIAELESASRELTDILSERVYLGGWIERVNAAAEKLRVVVECGKGEADE